MYLDATPRRIEVYYTYTCARCGSYLAAPGALDLLSFHDGARFAAECAGCGTIGPRVDDVTRAVPAFVGAHGCLIGCEEY